MSIFKKFLKDLADDAEKEINGFLDKLEEEANTQKTPSPSNGEGSHFHDSYSNTPHTDEEEQSSGSYEPDKTCWKCKQATVYHLGTDFVNGNPMTGASDCEVDHIYRCKSCGNKWTESY
ncbi:hypothetical protein [Microscilla marina]|uniref:Uncharacterized protein n=1 Tax=Microscilla marina ATCC 23134 TaxID=313606 RepID=A1ZQ89_MICM2|nr:hypothetical protein [Microscilla marina]EAY27498.1 hypothetical protein M23134_06899 [Microscilla marina ATCC 23134]